MKTIKFLVLILCGLTSSNLFAQSQEEYMAVMDAQAGEWILDKESIKMDPPSNIPIPDLKMTFAKDGDKYTRTVHFKTPEGQWMKQVSEVYEYNAGSNMLKFTGESMDQSKHRGQLILMANGNLHSIEFNSNNQKTGEVTVEMVNAKEMRASVKNFIYPETADQDMEIVNVQTTWKKQS
jgi:hypothetical protein